MLAPVLVLNGDAAGIAQPPVTNLRGSLEGPEDLPQVCHLLPVVVEQVPEEPRLVALLDVALGADVNSLLQWELFRDKYDDINQLP